MTARGWIPRTLLVAVVAAVATMLIVMVAQNGKPYVPSVTEDLVAVAIEDFLREHIDQGEEVTERYVCAMVHELSARWVALDNRDGRATSPFHCGLESKDGWFIEIVLQDTSAVVRQRSRKTPLVVNYEQRLDGPKRVYCYWGIAASQ